MKEIRLTRDFFRRPWNGLIILLSILVVFEAIGWSIAYTIKIGQVQNAGGAWHYLWLVLRGIVIPEMVSLFTLLSLINQYHVRFKIQTVTNTWRALGRYEFRIFPILLFSFWIFSPITQTVRYLLVKFPTYTLANYWKDYIVETLTWRLYFTYLFPVILVGYLIVNISLLKDYLQQRREAQEAAEAEAAEASQKAIALSTTFSPKPVIPSTNYLTYLKGKNNMGELDFPVNDVYYFTIEDRFYYAELAKGRYLVGKTLNDLDAELDPAQFFRIKRDYIVNRQAVLNYAYWENGKYIVRLNTPIPHEIIVPRARMHEFREWLQNADARSLEIVS